MSDLETLERRVNELERRLDDVIANRTILDATGEPVRRWRYRGGTSRILVGVVIILLGLMWLGQEYGVDWLRDIRFWPVAVIAFGLLIIFGERKR